MDEQKKSDFKVPTTADGKVDVQKLSRAILRMKNPLLHKFIVFFEWTYGIWFIWLFIVAIFFGMQAMEDLLVAGIVSLLFFIGPIFWMMEMFYYVINKSREAGSWTMKRHNAIRKVFTALICAYVLVLIPLLYVLWPVVLGPIFQEFIRRLFT